MKDGCALEAVLKGTASFFGLPARTAAPTLTLAGDRGRKFVAVSTPLHVPFPTTPHFTHHSVSLPQSLDAEHAATKQKLASLEGEAFNREYRKEMAKGHDMYEEVQQEGA